MASKLKVEDMHRFVFAGNSTFTLVRPAGPIPVVKDGASVVEQRPERRFTYMLIRAKGEDMSRPWFAKVMFGSNNNEDFRYLGTVFPSDEGPVLRVSAKGLKVDDVRFEGLKWLTEKLAWLAQLEKVCFEEKLAGQLFLPPAINFELDMAKKKFEAVEVWHEGKCGKCGRKLTVPASIESGLGPECAKSKGLVKK